MSWCDLVTKTTRNRKATAVALTGLHSDAVQSRTLPRDRLTFVAMTTLEDTGRFLLLMASLRKFLVVGFTTIPLVWMKAPILNIAKAEVPSGRLRNHPTRLHEVSRISMAKAKLHAACVLSMSLCLLKSYWNFLKISAKSLCIRCNQHPGWRVPR